MKKNLNENIRDINKENKAKEQSKIDISDVIIGLLIGVFLYFGYYMLMTRQFEKDPFKWPYILISIYFALSTLLYAYAHNRVSAWVENSKFIDLLFIPQTSILIAYIFAPIIFIIELF
ncbi:hypothetical protein [Tissierella creatinophila]|uniref:Uncharacterized protein n=1 Tax=Tissierella creatinophila DSM 6911 TaxID=1123403 RepID=A0A1U7M569_TISCR|nr:hypothetical protein [Tissierella creatinophila]OLS02462.1 hypothetical protein TICRE_15430 [Tissierella creatinophila DSM 6911]